MREHLKAALHALSRGNVEEAREHVARAESTLPPEPEPAPAPEPPAPAPPAAPEAPTA